jgi:hypothetical protein
MGQFSWIAQDTKKSISNINPRPITMVDDKGNKWTEKFYEGYGIFEGKDFYQLLAEMNNVEGLSGDVDKDRDLGIDLYFGDSPFISPNLYEDSNREWKNTIPEDCPDQGWTR